MSDSGKLLILHTNDIHSHLEQTAKVDTLFRSLRSGYGPHQTLTLDIGDHMDRMRMETEGTDGRVNIDILQRTGYDAVTPGNNEGLTFSADVLEQLYSDAPFTVICCNLKEQSTGEHPRWMKPYDILQKDGVTIGLIGATAAFSDFYELLGWTVSEPVSEIQLWVERIRPQVDILILMSHLGLRDDEHIAKTIPGIDFILGGHTHHLLETPRRIGNTWISAAGKFGNYCGMLEVEYDLVSRAVSRVKGCCIETEPAEPSAEIDQVIEEHVQKAAARLDQSVCVLPEKLEISWGKESPLGNLLASGLRSWAKADIGIVNAGQILEGLEPGKVTQGRLLEICPSPINPCRIKLKGKYIVQALEESLLPEFIQKSIYGFGFRGKELGTLCVDGMTIEYDDGLPPYSKLRSVWVGEEPLDPEKEYIVGTIDMFTFGIGYLSLAQGTDIVYYLPEFLRKVLAELLLGFRGGSAIQTPRWRTL